MARNLKLNTVILLALCGVGCGGGGGGDRQPPITPSVPDTAATYSVTLTAVTVTDRADGQDLSAAGLTIAGATATRD